MGKAGSAFLGGREGAGPADSSEPAETAQLFTKQPAVSKLREELRTFAGFPPSLLAAICDLFAGASRMRAIFLPKRQFASFFSLRSSEKSSPQRRLGSNASPDM